MGVEDRDWWINDRNKRASQKTNVIRFGPIARRVPPRSTGRISWGSVGIFVFWLAVMGLLYAGIYQYLKPKPLAVSAAGELVIPRARDGHFYADGSVNGKSVRFLVDTGATLVVVSEEFARSAGLSGGTPTVFRTANGELNGRVVSDVPVAVGPVAVSGVRIGVGLAGHEAGGGLLGQNFLSKFEVILQKDRMVLRTK